MSIVEKWLEWTTRAGPGRKLVGFGMPALVAIPLVAVLVVQVAAGDSEEANDRTVAPPALATATIAPPAPTATVPAPVVQALIATSTPLPTPIEAAVAPTSTPAAIPSPTVEPTATPEPPTATPQPPATATPQPTPSPEPTPKPVLYRPDSIGYDISFPQCPANFPANAAFGIIGVANGRPYTTNPCVRAQFQWAKTLSSPPSFYLNTSNPGALNENWGLPGPRRCLDAKSSNDLGCAYNFGWNGAAQGFATALDVTSAAGSYAWWLDVETENSWNGTTAANSAAIQGYLDYLKARGIATLGVYSNKRQWTLITGGYSIPGAPNWVAGASSPDDALNFCTASFSGGAVWLVQFQFSGFHGDYTCSGVGR